MKVGNNMTFDEWFKLACEYKNEHGDLLVPKEYKTESGKNLGSWIKEKRKYYFKNKLTTEQIEKLESIGMVWKVHEQAWDDMFALAVEYANEHGNLLVPQKYITENGKPLGIWISNCRIFYKNDKLSQEKIESLESIGMIWRVHDKKWDDMYAMVSLYYQKHGNLNIPCDYHNANNISLIHWIIRQRELYELNKLSKEQVEKLERLGMDWKKSKRHNWSYMYRLAENYYKEHGNLIIPGRYISENGEHLGEWILKNRRNYIKGKLSSDRIEKLENIGMVWEIVKKDCWEEMFEQASEYVSVHGNLLVPTVYKTENNKPLGLWIKDQRYDYKKNQLSKAKQEQLEAIGMVWTVCDYKWNTMLLMARRYYLEHGNLFIDDSSTLPDMKKLKKWLIYQRNLCIKGKLSKEKKKALESIGMVWDAKLSKENINIHLEELTVTIDKEKNKNVLKYISAIELQTKIRFLRDIGESPVDEKGRLIDIFTMSNHDIEEKYGVNIESLIKYYKKDNTRKLKLKL